MKKPKAKKAATKKKPREKPLSLHGMSFDEAVERLVRAKPAPKKTKKSK